MVVDFDLQLVLGEVIQGLPLGQYQRRFLRFIKSFFYFLEFKGAAAFRFIKAQRILSGILQFERYFRLHPALTPNKSKRLTFIKTVLRLFFKT